MTLNVVFTLNQLSYVSHSDYHTYTESLRAAAAKIPSSDQDFYRVGKTVLRTKMMPCKSATTGPINSIQCLSPPYLRSMANWPASRRWVCRLYQWHLNQRCPIRHQILDFAAHGWRSTAATCLLANSGESPDLNLYTKRGQTSNLTLHQNPYALGIGFVASQNILKTRLFSDAPLANQEMMLNALTGQKAYSVLFSNVALSAPKTKGVSAAKATTGTTYTKSLSQKRRR